MNKRYQVFVSSTYVDLHQERQRVIQTLMEMDCIPSGMELFPALDEEQWAFIKRVIEDCDYYLLIIGGRYGSTTPEGISYTEKEYDYAIERGIKVIALIHSNPEEIPIEKSETSPELKERLTAFREKVSKGRLVKSWKGADELPGLVALSLSKTIKIFPAVGWIRADKAPTTQLLNELNELRKSKEELEKELTEFRKNQKTEMPDIASLEDTIFTFGTSSYFDSYTKRRYTKEWKLDISWSEIFALLSPFLLDHPNDVKTESILARILGEKVEEGNSSFKIDTQVYQTIKIQFQALRLINIRYSQAVNGTMALFWSLTETGHALMMSLRTIKSTDK